MKSPKYIWKYYIRPFLLDIDPNTRQGLDLQAEKQKEDNRNNNRNSAEVNQ